MIGRPAGMETAPPAPEPPVRSGIGPHGIGLVAVDLDGTLLDSVKRIAARDLDALLRAQEAGVAVAVITGRRFAELEDLTRQLPASIFRAGHGGALVRRGDATLTEILLPKAVAETTAAISRRRSLTLVISDRDGGVRISASDPGSPRVRRYLSTIRPAPRLDPAPRFAEDPVHLVLAGSPGPCREAEAELREVLGAAASLERTEYAATNLALVDVLGAEASKGAALRSVAAAAGVPMASTLAIGDNWNDLSMLRAAGTGVLMANAEAGLRGLGFETTGSNDDQGVAAALDRFLFVPVPRS